MKTIVFLIIFFFFSNLKAATILDYETETFISNIISIITKANKYEKNISFSIILDDKPNAYVSKNNKLFISTGLLKYVESYEALVGVLAHEIGHLQKFHISKRKDSIKKLQNINNLTNFSIIAGSLISSNSDYMISSLVTNNIGIHNYIQSFSRNQEREADYYAIETLNKLNLSSIPLVKFLIFLESQSTQKGIRSEFYKFSSHPIYEERYDIINNIKSNQKHNFDKKTNQELSYIRAKLFGFTEDSTNSLGEYLKGDFYFYAESIILSKKGKLKSSMIILNNLIQKKPNNFFLLETKADILYSNGFLNESLLFYKKSIQLNPKNIYIKKRIFDIKFSLNKIENLNTSKRLFSEFSFLLQIFSNNVDLKNKFKVLAFKTNKSDWIKYFSTMDKFNNNTINGKEIIEILDKIKNNSSDSNLKELINKNKSKINEKI